MRGDLSRQRTFLARGSDILIQNLSSKPIRLARPHSYGQCSFKTVSPIVNSLQLIDIRYTISWFAKHNDRQNDLVHVVETKKT